MLKAITKKILVILVLFTGVKLNAQQWLGRTTGNYSGTYGLYNNASSIADSKYRYYFNFWGRGVNFYNNGLLYNAPIKLNQWANGTYDPFQQRPDGKADFQKDWLIENLNGKTKQFSFNQDIWGPAFMFPISRAVNMSINTRQRSSLQIFGVSEPLARFAYNGLDSSSGIYNGSNAVNRNTSYSNGKFGINATSYQELSFSFAGVLAKNAKNQLSGGLTVKFIRGLGAAYVKGNGFDFSATGNNTALIQNADIQYAYTDDKSVVAPFNKPYGLFTLDSKGAGAGVDLGLTYIHRSRPGKYAKSRFCNDNANKSDYDFKLAAAFNDLGGIHFNQGAVKYTYANTSPITVNANSNILNGFNQPTHNAFDTIGKNVFGQMGASRTNGFNTSLPTAFNLQMDFRMSEHLFTSVYWNQSMKSVNSTGMRSTSMVSVIPRVESRGFEFSMPLTLSENYKNFYVGAYARFGPVFIGSDNLGGLLNVASNNQFRGADIYGGVSFGIGHCHKWWYEEKVEPNHIDTVKQRDTILKKDTLKTVKRDTIRIIKHDTIKIKVRDTVIINKKGEVIQKVVHDTIIIEKTIRSKADIDKEIELKKKEDILNARQKQLDQKERDLLNREKGTYNESEILRNCKTQTVVLTDENTVLKNKVNTQADEISKLKLQIETLNKNKAKTDAEILAIKGCSGVIQYDEAGKPLSPCQMYENELSKRKSMEIINAYKDKVIDSLNRKIASTDAEILVLRRQLGSKTEPVLTGTDAIKLQKVQKQLDSLTIKMAVLQTELSNCKKASSATDAEIIKATTAKSKADAQVITSNKRADSLQNKLTSVEIDLTNCRKNAGSSSDAEIIKAKTDKAIAEADAKAANRRADSLQVKISGLIVELTACKKGASSSTDAEIIKAKSEKAKADAEVITANRKIDSLQVKITGLVAELTSCKNSNSNSTDATIIKLKKCEDDAALYKAELAAANKTNLALNAKVYKRDATIDSLLTELSKCGNNNGSDNNAELLKKCNDTKAEMSAEIVSLKAKVSNAAKSLDSANLVASNLRKNQATLEAQIVDLKAQNKGSDCTDIKKQLDEKIILIADLNAQNAACKTNVTNLTNQLNELKQEYQFVNAQNQKCSKKLDSCMRGLFNNQDNGGIAPGSGNGGPSEGSIKKSDDSNFGVIENSNDASTENSKDNKNDTVIPSQTGGTKNNDTSKEEEVILQETPKEKPLILLKILGAIAKGIIESGSSGNSNNSGSSSTGNNGSQPSNKPTTTTPPPTTGAIGTNKPGNNTGSSNNNSKPTTPGAVSPGPVIR